MARILITGAFGLLGSSLVPALAAAGHAITRVGRSEQADVRVELTDADAVRRCLASVAPEVVINLAALTNVDRCETHPQEAYLANTHIVENLVAALNDAASAPHLIQISTDQLYDGAGPHAEDDVALTNYYAFSKYAAELAAAHASSTVVRTNFFGRSQHASRASFSDWIVGALRRGESVRVFDDVRFSPLSLTSLSRYLTLLVERRPRGVFNLGARAGMSKADFCFAIASVLGLSTHTMARGHSSDSQLRAYRPKDMCMDCTRFERTLEVQLPTLTHEIESMREEYHARA